MDPRSPIVTAFVMVGCLVAAVIVGYIAGMRDQAKVQKQREYEKHHRDRKQFLIESRKRRRK